MRVSSTRSVKNGKSLQGRVIKQELQTTGVKKTALEPVTYAPHNEYDRRMKTSASRLLAISTSEIYNKPLFAGAKTGVVEMGEEYIYLGHTRSGWVKVLLPDGMTGWTNTRFEVVKFDVAEMDVMPGDTEFVDSKSGNLARVSDTGGAGL